MREHMIEAYSNNISVNSGEAVTFNNVALKSGCSSGVSGASITLLAPGVYKITVTASGITPAAESSSPAPITLQLRKDGVEQPQAFASATASSATDVQTLSFSALVKARAFPCNSCADPTTCSILNKGAAATFSGISVIITKV